jgi:hypothetical protein
VEIGSSDPVAADQSDPRLQRSGICPAPARSPSEPPGRFGDLSELSIEELTDVVTQAWGGGRAAGPHRRGARVLLSHLAGFPGPTWQERWEASGLDTPGQRVADIAGPPVGRAGHREAVTRGLRALLCVRAFSPR